MKLETGDGSILLYGRGSYLIFGWVWTDRPCLHLSIGPFLFTVRRTVDKLFSERERIGCRVFDLYPLSLILRRWDHAHS